ncbi:hypothetical protein SAMN02745883_02115 [Caminicella sporogenes DSM 14501]|uniref:Uncharacterized protein n=1 Tax=Caminicella sporogenes DSM 14501 TaxID=1121266 RepID=A0A1M6SQT4_9FIRM|nr:hypothetical protein [Caminicella sporogenes]RKD26425.1 hypothetical protein BET04_10715 [Caminicella sporogenes]SHK46997.1 hypothetical protein SAMN02745883_02115 [Caminicella sporogenes DSM 14501]
MNKREKMYVIVIIILLAILTVKSLFLDEFKPRTYEEKMFKEYVEKLTYKRYNNNFFMKKGLINFRVVSIKKIDDKGISIIEVKDENNNNYKQVKISGKYKAKIRKYVLHILPYGEDKVLSRK